MNYMGSVPNSNKTLVTQPNPYTTYIATSKIDTDQAWCLDNGASHRVTNDLTQLQQVNKFHGKTKLAVGNGNILPIQHIGSTALTSLSHKPILLKNMIHSPQISRNLISVSQLTAQNNLCV